jgi:hypothetical protein
MQKPGSALEILAQIVASMSVPDVWRFRAGLPVVLALFSAIFWLLRQLKWRNRHQVVLYLLVSTRRTVGYVGATVAILSYPVLVTQEERAGRQLRPARLRGCLIRGIRFT